MKGFIVFALCIIAVSAQRDAEVQQLFKKCGKKESADLGKLGDAMRKLKSGETNFDLNIKCFLACVLEERKIMEPDMSFNYATAEELTRKMFKGDEEKLKKVMEIFKECIDLINDTDRCERAWEYNVCLIPKFKELGFN